MFAVWKVNYQTECLIAIILKLIWHDKLGKTPLKSIFSSTQEDCNVIGCLYQVDTGCGTDDEFGQALSCLPEVDILLWNYFKNYQLFIIHWHSV